MKRAHLGPRPTKQRTRRQRKLASWAKRYGRNPIIHDRKPRRIEHSAIGWAGPAQARWLARQTGRRR